MAGVARGGGRAIEEAGLKVFTVMPLPADARARYPPSATAARASAQHRSCRPADGEIALRNEGQTISAEHLPICSTASTGQMQRGLHRRNHGLGLGIVGAIAACRRADMVD